MWSFLTRPFLHCQAPRALGRQTIALPVYSPFFELLQKHVETTFGAATETAGMQHGAGLYALSLIIRIKYFRCLMRYLPCALVPFMSASRADVPEQSPFCVIVKPPHRYADRSYGYKTTSCD